MKLVVLLLIVSNIQLWICVGIICFTLDKKLEEIREKVFNSIRNIKQLKKQINKENNN